MENKPYQLGLRFFGEEQLCLTKFKIVRGSQKDLAPCVPSSPNWQWQFNFFSNMMWMKRSVFLVFVFPVISTMCSGLPVGPDLSGLS